MVGVAGKFVELPGMELVKPKAPGALDKLPGKTGGFKESTPGTGGGLKLLGMLGVMVVTPALGVVIAVELPKVPLLAVPNEEALAGAPEALGMVVLGVVKVPGTLIEPGVESVPDEPRVP